MKRHSMNEDVTKKQRKADLQKLRRVLNPGYGDKRYKNKAKKPTTKPKKTKKIYKEPELPSYA